MTAIETIHTVLTNVLAHPGDTKYYQINLANPSFSRRMNKVSNGLAILVALGFREEEGGTLVLPPSVDLRCLEARKLELAVHHTPPTLSIHTPSPYTPSIHTLYIHPTHPLYHPPYTRHTPSPYNHPPPLSDPSLTHPATRWVWSYYVNEPLSKPKQRKLRRLPHHQPASPAAKIQNSRSPPLLLLLLLLPSMVLRKPVLVVEVVEVLLPALAQSMMKRETPKKRPNYNSKNEKSTG